LRFLSGHDIFDLRLVIRLVKWALGVTGLSASAKAMSMLSIVRSPYVKQLPEIFQQRKNPRMPKNTCALKADLITLESRMESSDTTHLLFDTGDSKFSCTIMLITGSNSSSVEIV
jgi:hypothetical protein